MNWLLAIGTFYGAWALWMLFEIGRAVSHDDDDENDEDENDDDEPTNR
jgi:hypothetical protein